MIARLLKIYNRTLSQEATQKNATKAKSPDRNATPWDTDGTVFVNDNSTTDIIYIGRKLFPGLLVPTRITLETVEGMTPKIYM